MQRKKNVNNGDIWIFTENFKVFAQLTEVLGYIPYSPFEHVIAQPFSLVDNEVMQMG